MDHSSCANTQEIVTKHLNLLFDVDFERSVIAGQVELQMTVLKADLAVIKLDARGLAVESVYVNGVVCGFTTRTEYEALGQVLEIAVAAEVRATTAWGEGRCSVQVKYATSPEASGLQWLPAAQTEGKKHPYLFSQFQAIHARSCVPCQDTPSVKATYECTVYVPAALTALMSALALGTNDVGHSVLPLTTPLPAGKRQFSFRQALPIPSYLIALVVGDLVSAEIGPRSRVWTEPALLEKCRYEFADTETYIATAERLLTPYEWGRYDILVLPGSFPYGGMENPMLTFVTPSLLAGDRSLTDVVAHEIAHSWMGNLVTSRTWEHFWLNEGFTVYVERKILGRLQGEPMRHFAAWEGKSHLEESVRHYGETHNFTALVPDLKGGMDPDDAFSSVPYEKGFMFLFYLEHLFGQEPLENFLQQWVNRHRRATATSADCRRLVEEVFAARPEQLQKINWDAWFSAPGMPAADVMSVIRYDRSLLEQSSKLSQQWLRDDGSFKPSPADIDGWKSRQLCAFLADLLAAEKTLSQEKVQRMADTYKFDRTANAEITMKWSQLVIRTRFTKHYPAIVAFLQRIGRMKFVRPLYRELAAAGDEGKLLALQTFDANKSRYHNICSKMVARDLATYRAKKAHNPLCTCGDNCKCGDNCQCGTTAAAAKPHNPLCTCGTNCKCGDNCKCGTVNSSTAKVHNPLCTCGTNCKCGDNCKCGTAKSSAMSATQIIAYNAFLVAFAIYFSRK